MPIQYEQKSFSVGPNDASSGQKYRDNYDRIFGKSPKQDSDPQRQGQDRQDRHQDQEIQEELEQ